MIMPQYSGVVQVGDPDELAYLENIEMTPTVDGFLYTYVTNRSAGFVHFDNLKIKYWKPQVRVQYDYYPYGLPWENPATTGEEALHDCLYQDKEFQFKDFEDGNKGLALFDFHARMYDPSTAMWSVPDPAAQFANPYLAMGNNPVIGIDPDGREFVIAAVVIGAIIGTYIGGTLANDSYDPTQWSYNSTTFGYMLGGSIVGGLSGWAGGAIAASGMPLANTASIAASSLISSTGTHIYTGGETDISMSFGVGSWNTSNGEVEGLWDWKELSAGERIGYSLGALTMASDVVDWKSSWNVKHRKAGGEVVNTEPGWGGRNYLGPSGDGDPRARLSEGLFPIDELDWSAFDHDVYYYDRGANGITGALLNKTVRAADLTLAREAFRTVGQVSNSWAIGTGVTFYGLFGLKTAMSYSYLYPYSWLNQK